MTRPLSNDLTARRRDVSPTAIAYWQTEQCIARIGGGRHPWMRAPPRHHLLAHRDVGGMKPRAIAPRSSHETGASTKTLMAVSLPRARASWALEDHNLRRRTQVERHDRSHDGAMYGAPSSPMSNRCWCRARARRHRGDGQPPAIRHSRRSCASCHHDFNPEMAFSKRPPSSDAPHAPSTGRHR